MWSQSTNVTDRRTDRQTTCDRNKVHRAVKTGLGLLKLRTCKWRAIFDIVFLTSTRINQAVPRIADRTASQHLWGWRDVIGYVTIWYPICHFQLVVLWNGYCLSPVVFKILRCKRVGVMSLTFQGHAKSSITWPFDNPCHFLLVCLWDQPSISNAFQDIQRRM